MAYNIEINGSDFCTRIRPVLASHTGGYALFTDGDLRYVALSNPRMMVVRRTAEEFFSTTVTRVSNDNRFKAVINGGLYNNTYAGLLDAVIGHDPVPAAETIPIGYVRSGGNKVCGTSAPSYFHVGFRNSDSTFSFEMGDPPSTMDEGTGGGGPMIITNYAYGRIKYGNGNLYRAGVPAGAPTTGEPGPLYLPYLIQRNNETYKSMLAKPNSTGKAVVAQIRGYNIVLLIVQPNGVTGMSIDTLRDKLWNAGISNAVFLDGSDSAMLMYDNQFIVRQGDDKDELTTIGLGFL